MSLITNFFIVELRYYIPNLWRSNMLVGTHTLDVDTGSEQIYNAMDCCITHEVFGTLATNTNLAQAQPAYGFELALQAPVLEMMLRGWRINPSARELGLESTKRDLDRLEYIMQVLASGVWDKDISRRNPKGKLI